VDLDRPEEARPHLARAMGIHQELGDDARLQRIRGMLDTLGPG
jgi:hypothetical protein